MTKGQKEYLKVFTQRIDITFGVYLCTNMFMNLSEKQVRPIIEAEDYIKL